MKSAFLILPVALVATAVVFGQAASQATPQAAGDKQVLGRGRGGAPFAWNDKDKDGICDLTGRPVGQGRPVAFGCRARAGGYAWGDRDGDGVCDFTGRPVGMGRGRGAWGRGAGAWGRGWRGWGRGFGPGPATVQTAPQNPPAESPAAQPKQ